MYYADRNHRYRSDEEEEEEEEDDEEEGSSVEEAEEEEEEEEEHAAHAHEESEEVPAYTSGGAAPLEVGPNGYVVSLPFHLKCISITDCSSLYTG